VEGRVRKEKKWEGGLGRREVGGRVTEMTVREGGGRVREE
jgi:hypothetical protein